MPFGFPSSGGGAAAEEIRTKGDAAAAITITLAGLATGAARASAGIPNPTGRPSALVTLLIRSGAVAPTVGTVYEVYLLRFDGLNGDDGWTTTDSAIVIENAPMLGAIVVTATANKNFFGVFDTSPLGFLGATGPGVWGIAVRNMSGQALNAVEATHYKSFQTYLPEIQ